LTDRVKDRGSDECCHTADKDRRWRHVVVQWDWISQARRVLDARGPQQKTSGWNLPVLGPLLNDVATRKYKKDIHIVVVLCVSIV